MDRTKRFIIAVLALCAVIALPFSAMAFGGHEGLTCTGCHSIHDAKDDIIFAVKANTQDVNANTKKPFEKISALCLGCHQEPEKGGMGIKPISSHMSHPYGLSAVNAKVAKVPGSLLRNGKFECVGCHDPHPSNPNYRYLRIATSNGSQMQKFCAVCHPMKTDPKVAAEKVKIFSSMDETAYTKPAPKKMPEAPKKSK